MNMTYQEAKRVIEHAEAVHRYSDSTVLITKYLLPSGERISETESLLEPPEWYYTLSNLTTGEQLCVI